VAFKNISDKERSATLWKIS